MSKWSASVTLGGQDVSSRLVGNLSVEAEESTSRIAEFTIIPLSGLIQAGDWIGAAVTIDHIDDPDGAATSTRIFTGNVNKSIFDPVNITVQFECTDNLQGHFELMTEAQILTAITGGSYAEEVFGEREDGWQQAVDVLSTVPKGYDLNRDGVTPALTDWSANSVADYSFNDSNVIDESVEIDLIRLRDLVNKVTISAEYRYTRLHHREHDFSWAAKIGLNGGFDFCDYFANSYELPTRDMVQGAGAAGWAIKDEQILFETLPVTGTYNCGGTVGWSISEELLNQLVVDAQWTVVRRWSQTITENYTITVQDLGSINQHGELLYEDGAGWQTDFDDSGWDSSTGTDIPLGWVQNALGDYSEDQLDRTNANNAILTLMNVAATRICESHRQNFVSWEAEIVPDIERSHTASISSGIVTSKGKVFQYIHNLNIDTGEAKTNVKIAVSQTWPGGSEDIIAVPAAPDTSPTHMAPASGTNLDNRIGNDDSVPNFDETWTGFTGNFTVASGTPTPEQTYPRRFRVETGDIEDESRDEASALSDTTFGIKCPDEQLVITVGLGPGESVFVITGSSSASLSAVPAVVTESVASASGAAVISGVGGSIQTIESVMSSSGSSLVSGVGDDNFEDGNLESNGLSSTSFISAADSNSIAASSCASIASFVSNQYSQIVIADSPVGYWRLGESSGTTASDEIGSNDGAYVAGTGTITLGSAGLVANDSNTAVDFSSTHDGVALNYPNYDALAVRTIEAWVRTNDLASNQIVFKEGGSFNGFAIGIVSSNFEVGIADGGVSKTVGVSTSGYAVNTPIHLVGVINTTTNSLRLYVDGVLEAVDTGTTLNNVGGSDNARIGCGADEGVSGGSGVSTNPLTLSNADDRFIGRIDEVAIYDYELSASEVLDHYNVGIGV